MEHNLSARVPPLVNYSPAHRQAPPSRDRSLGRSRPGTLRGRSLPVGVIKARMPLEPALVLSPSLPRFPVVKIAGSLECARSQFSGVPRTASRSGPLAPPVFGACSHQESTALLNEQLLHWLNVCVTLISADSPQQNSRSVLIVFGRHREGFTLALKLSGLCVFTAAYCPSS